jgi:hypothetical protein
MTALAANRDTKSRDGKTFSLPVAASTKIYQGSIVCLNVTTQPPYIKNNT